MGRLYWPAVTSAQALRGAEPLIAVECANRSIAPIRKWSALGATAITAVFLGLATHAVEQPGLYYDELIQAVPALAFLRGGVPGYQPWVPEGQLWLGHHEFPLMIMPYIGGLKTAFYVPIVAVFGLTPETLRFFTIALAAGSLVATYAFVNVLFGPAIGLAATALLAVDSSFVLLDRVDYGPLAVMHFLEAVALWQLALWWKRRRVGNLALGMFVLGLGVYDKANFIWIVTAVVVAGAIAGRSSLLSWLRSRQSVVAAGCFMLGAAPLIWYNLSDFPPGTIVALFGPATAGGPSGGFWQQFGQRLDLLGGVLDGSAIGGLIGSTSDPSPVVPLLVVLSVLVIILQSLRDGPCGVLGPGLFAVGCAGLVLLGATATRGGFAVHHVILTYPFPQIVVAAAAASVAGVCARRLRRDGRGRLVATTAVFCALLVIPVASEVRTTLSDLQMLDRSGGAGNWSDAEYAMVDYLSHEHPQALVVSLDWGLHFNVMAISQGHANALELWQDLNTPEADSSPLLSLLRRPDVIFVLHAPKATNFSTPRMRFFEIAQGAGIQVVLDRTFSTRSGEPILELYRSPG
jgi:hypothetical protein